MREGNSGHALAWPAAPQPWEGRSSLQYLSPPSPPCSYSVVNSLRSSAHSMRKTLLVSLLQPPPEVLGLFGERTCCRCHPRCLCRWPKALVRSSPVCSSFPCSTTASLTLPLLPNHPPVPQPLQNNTPDDLLLLTDGRVLFHGPVPEALPHFLSLGFACPVRKDPASWLQEITTPGGIARARLCVWLGGGLCAGDGQAGMQFGGLGWGMRSHHSLLHTYFRDHSLQSAS